MVDQAFDGDLDIPEQNASAAMGLGREDKAARRRRDARDWLSVRRLGAECFERAPVLVRAATLPESLSEETRERLLDSPRMTARLGRRLARLSDAPPLEDVSLSDAARQVLTEGETALEALGAEAAAAWRASEILGILRKSETDALIAGFGQDPRPAARRWRMTLESGADLARRETPDASPWGDDGAALAGALHEESALCLAAWYETQPAAVRARIAALAPEAALFGVQPDADAGARAALIERIAAGAVS